MPIRRALLAVPFLLAAPALAQDESRRPPALPTPLPVRLRPGAAPVMAHARIGDGGQQPIEISFTGPGAPTEVFRLPSWYGNARIIGVLRVRDRDLLVVAFEGNTGTGVYQEIQAVIGVDDDGVARILALETLHNRLTAICNDASYLTIRITPLADGKGLRLNHFARGVFGTCGPPTRRPRPFRAEWGTTLRWNGRGPFSVPPPDPRAGPERRLVEASRAKVAAWLAAAPRREVTHDDMQALDLMEVLRNE
jgi:hypothetical protein